MSRILHWLQRAANTAPHKNATIYKDSCRTFWNLQNRIAALVAALVSLGIAPGDRVILLADTSDDLLEAILAVSLIGAIFAPLNTKCTSKEIADAVSLLCPSLVICNTHSAAQFPDNQVVLLGDQKDRRSTESLISANLGAELFQRPAPDDVAAIVFTSGTTGPAKGVMLSNAALLFQAEAKIQSHGYCEEDVYLHTAPVYHVGGLISWLAMLKAGATHIILPKFSVPACLSAIQTHNVSALIAVPAMIADLLGSKDVTQLPSVTKLLLGGGELPAHLRLPLLELLPNAEIWAAYGMTECASSITTMHLEAAAPIHTKTHAVKVGRPPKGIQIRINAVDSRQEARTPSKSRQTGNAGEVLVKGPPVMVGYWHDSPATAAAFLQGGWLRTGDLGLIDSESSLWLCGRLKDVIRSGSENVSASEVERVLVQHPEIAAAAVVGLPHPRLGETVSALIQTRAEASQLSPEEVQNFCRARGMAGFKLPRIILLQDKALPVNSSGKVLKPAVRSILGRSPDIKSKL